MGGRTRAGNSAFRKATWTNVEAREKCTPAPGTKGVHHSPPKPERVPAKESRKMNSKRPLVQKRERQRRHPVARWEVEVRQPGCCRSPLSTLPQQPGGAAGHSLHEAPRRKPTSPCTTPQPHHSPPLAGSWIRGLTPPSLLVLFCLGRGLGQKPTPISKTIWSFFSFFLTVHCQKRKTSRPMKTYRNPSEEALFF